MVFERIGASYRQLGLSGEAVRFLKKAVAEIPKDGVAPAVRNAIRHATGVTIDQLPFTPERVWRALNAR
jgi:CO/xanthine dehydrogenase Mo-binding subunit